MPYVTVVFDPTKVSQETVDELKKWLQENVAEVLSSRESITDEKYDTYSDAVVLKVIKTSSDEIMVMQHATHPTDVNVPPLEIYIQAGRPKARDGDKIVKLLGQLVSESEIVPEEYLGDGQAGIFVTFHEHNGFGFIPRHN